MSAGAPWSVKGIDPKTREIAKDLARRSGMTLGEWLNHMITQGDADDEAVTPLARRTAEYRGPDRRSRARRLDDAYHDDDPDELTRVTRALEDLSERIEAAERRSTIAVSGIDQAVAGLLTRLETAEREQSTQARRLEDFAEDRREDLDRLRRMEREVSGPRSVEALRALEGSLSKIAGQIYETETRTRAQLSEVQGGLAANERRIERLEARPEGGAIVEQVVSKLAERLERAEAQTSTAMRQLETSFAHLDERLRGAENRLEGDKLEKLASDLSQRVADARIELIQRFDTVSGNRFDKVERALADLSGHVQQAETRSAQAIEKLGQEVLRIAQNLNGRMNEVEQAGEAVVQRVGGDMARIAEAVESRLRKADDTQAQMLERLGGEIARISEKLGDRIIQSERRSALTAEDLGERVGRMADKLEARYDKASGELAERIRASEERTARLLEEARATLDRIHGARPASEPEPIPAPAPPPVAAQPAAAEPPGDPEPPFPSAFGGGPFAMSDEADAMPASFPEQPEPEPAFGAFGAEQSLGASPFDSASDSAGGFDEFEAETDFVQPSTFAAGAGRPAVSTKEAIDAARAAARLGVRNSPPDEKGGNFALSGLKLGAKKRLQERLVKEKKRETSTVKKALLASATAATVSTLAAGYWLYFAEPEGGYRKDGKDGLKIEQAEPIAAVSLSAGTTGLPGGAQAESAYQEAVKKLEAGAADAVQVLSNAANLGSPAAQFHLARLYETGEHDVSKDAQEARRWTERAALGGYPPAMHNLAMQYYDGIGGAKDPAAAAQWFLKAAETGLVDSQFNLGRLFEQGIGVPRNPTEAYKWYLVAAASADEGAQTSADAIAETLSERERQAAERAAIRFQAAQAVSAQSATPLAGR